MMIPKYDEIMYPALKMLQTVDTLKIKDFRMPLAQHFKLTEQDLAVEYDSGNGSVFPDRISWALSYLYLAGLVEKPQRAIYKITDKGRDMLAGCDEEAIRKYVKNAAQNYPHKKDKTVGKKTTPSAELNITDTPSEQLLNSFDQLKQSISSDILKTIIGKKPKEFERLVVKLLQAMGYGGEIRNSGQVTKLSKDGGIDGIIKEDILGFGRIYIQAKRYARDRAVERDEIQKFVGALAVVQSNKGAFITTSYFSKGAVDYVKSLNNAATIVLMDGVQLAEYIYDFGVGMQLEQTIKVKKMDSDFWDMMEDE